MVAEGCGREVLHLMKDRKEGKRKGPKIRNNLQRHAFWDLLPPVRAHS
jgi:hypothetical protein